MKRPRATRTRFGTLALLAGSLVLAVSAFGPGHADRDTVLAQVPPSSTPAPQLPPPPKDASALWIGNDNEVENASTYDTVWHTGTTVADATGAPPAYADSVVSTPAMGLAYDGTYLYIGDNDGYITKRKTSDPSTVVARFGVSVATSLNDPHYENLAWDAKRQVLWRVVLVGGTCPSTGACGPILQKIDPSKVTGSLAATDRCPNPPSTTAACILADASYLLTSPEASPGTTDPILGGPLGGVGVAHDPGRDRLYVSFTTGGSSRGLVERFDPTQLVPNFCSTCSSTPNVGSNLFRTSGYLTTGLAFDPATSSLWVGDFAGVRHLDLTGQLLSPSQACTNLAGYTYNTNFTLCRPDHLNHSVEGLAFIAPAKGQPTALSCKMTSTLVVNGCFDGPQGVLSTYTTTPGGGSVITGPGPTPAGSPWEVFNNNAGTTTTDLLPNTLSKSFGSPTGQSVSPGTNLLHVTTDGQNNGLAQQWQPTGSGPATACFSVFVFVVRGQVEVAAGNGGQTGGTPYSAYSSTTGQWQLLQGVNAPGQSPVNELIMYAHSSGFTDFYVSNASVVPGSC